jgi:hypothetical protein
MCLAQLCHAFVRSPREKIAQAAGWRLPA